MPGYYYYHAEALDQREIVWPKLQVLKRKYLTDMEALYELLSSFDTQVLSVDHARKLNLYKEVVRRLLTYLNVSRENLPLEFKQNLLESFAEHIVTIIEIFRKKPDHHGGYVAQAPAVPHHGSSLSGDLRQPRDDNWSISEQYGYTG
ncbi:unnamed protein product [Calypogeia fissa]